MPIFKEFFNVVRPQRHLCHLLLAAPPPSLVSSLRHVVRNRGADEVVPDAEQSQQHRVVAHRLGKVCDLSHLREEPVDGGQDVSDEERGGKKGVDRSCIIFAITSSDAS